MIKNFVLSIISIAVLVGVVYLSDVMHGWAAQANDDSSRIIAEDTGLDRYIENDAFGIGEKLRFDIGYGFINAGYATLEVADLIEYNERPCYLVLSTANSNKFFSSFYRVEDKVESIIDATGIFSWRFEKQLREGKYRATASRNAS